MLFLEHYGLTDAGKVRQNNEDSLLVGDGRDTSLFAVADGIGGFEAGEVASKIAVEALKELGPEGSFETAIRGAHNRILDASREDENLSGMGTTVVAVRFSGTESGPEGGSGARRGLQGVSLARRGVATVDRGPLAGCGAGS